MRRVIWLVVTMSVVPFVHPAAQQLGQRIRVLQLADTPRRWIVGDLVADDGDSLQLQVGGRTQPVSIARHSLARLEVGRGPKRAVLEGAGIGAGWGVIIGALTHVGRRPLLPRAVGGIAASAVWTGAHTGHETRKVFERYNIVNERDLRDGVAKLALLH